ncbi:MAG: DUF1552 domain-containing protein [Polyangiaceae bacterium]
MRDRAFGRRDLLRAAGATLLVPSFLRQAFASPQSVGPRLVIVMQALGTHQAAFWPDATGTSPILDPILGDAALRAKTVVVKGVHNMTTGVGNEHDRGFNSLWTGVKPVGFSEDCFGGGPSIDQILRRSRSPKVQFPTLNTGVLAADVAPKNGHRRSFIYSGPQQPLPTRIDPYRLYAMLFPQAGDSSPEAAARRLALRQSVLDQSAKDLAALSGRLGPNERRKLDAHATALREYETRLVASSGTTNQCAKPAGFAPGIDFNSEQNVPVLMELILDLMAVALSCNLTNIVTFQIGYCGNQWRYRWLGIDKDTHEEIAHFDAHDGSNAAATEGMIRMGRWVAENVARFTRKLDAVPEAGGTALDNSLVVWANENSDGLHGMANLPIVMMGRAGGALQRTGVVDEGEQTHYQLCTSVMNLMGVPVAGFGDQPTAGPLRGLA